MPAVTTYTPREWKVLRWIKRKPVPSKLKGELSDGDEVTCIVAERGTGRWIDSTRSMEGAVRITALDQDGAVLRVLNLPDESQDPEPEEDGRSTAAHNARSDFGRAPIQSIDVPKLINNLADAMVKVAQNSAEQQSVAMREGFSAMTSVVNLALKMLVAVEERLAAVETGPAPPEQTAPTDMRDQLAQMLLTRSLGGTPADAASNGHAGNLLSSLTPEQIQQGLAFLQQLNGPAAAGENGS